MSNNQLQKCSRCRKKKSLEAFGYNKNGVSFKTCISCREEKKEYSKNYREKNPDYNKNYREAHKEERKEYSKNYREKNPDYAKNYREAHKHTLHHKFIKMLNSSKGSDIKYNRYDEENFVDIEFLQNLYNNMLDEDGNIKCIYCNCIMIYDTSNYSKNLITIERMDNSIGHIKSNITYCCYSCNAGKVGQR